jgi:hypothetical protein
MSDHQTSPDWWLASDGKWYPPDQAPPVPPPETWATPAPVAARSAGLSSGAITALVVVGVLVVLAAIGLAAAIVGTDADPTTDGASSTDATAAADPDPADVPDAAPPTVPEGFEVADGDGASIAVPAAWTVLDAADVAMSPEELAEAFPDASPEVIEQEAAMFEEGAVLVAFDYTDDDFASNVNILRFPVDLGLDELADQAELEIEGIGGTVRSNRQVQLPAGPAVRVAYDADVTRPDGSTRAAHGVQHYVPVGGRTYVITVTSADDAGELSDRMAATFRVG